MSVEEVAIPGGDSNWTAHNVSNLISSNGIETQAAILGWLRAQLVVV